MDALQKEVTALQQQHAELSRTATASQESVVRFERELAGVLRQRDDAKDRLTASDELVTRLTAQLDASNAELKSLKAEAAAQHDADSDRHAEELQQLQQQLHDADVALSTTKAQVCFLMSVSTCSAFAVSFNLACWCACTAAIS